MLPALHGRRPYALQLQLQLQLQRRQHQALAGSMLHNICIVPQQYFNTMLKDFVAALPSAVMSSFTTYHRCASEQAQK